MATDDPEHDHLPGLEPPGPVAPVDREAAVDHRAAHLAKADRRGPDTIWRPNPREQGLLGLTDAIAYFGSRGWLVSLPLIDSQPYDLVVDDGERLHRVQVKTTTARSRSGRFVVSLCTNGGNQSFHTKKRFEPTSCELLFVLDDERTRWVIPTEVIRARTALTLAARLESYRVP